MRDDRFQRGGRMARVMFGCFALCTGWLVVQNTVLVAWLLHDHLAGGRFVQGLVGAALVATLVPVAFAIGWFTSRPHRTPVAGGCRGR